MDDKGILISKELLFEQVFESLRRGDSAVVRVTGNSMHPTFYHGKDTIVFSPCDAANLQRGDVVLFDRGDTICAHRIIGKKGNTYIIRGDGNSFKSLEYATPDKIYAKITSGTMRNGHPFTIEDKKWKDNTYFVLNHPRLLEFWHRIRRVLFSYPLSILVSLVLLYLSFFNPGSLPIPGISNPDKWVHGIMYFGISLTYWFEWLRVHGASDKSIPRGFLFCLLFPVILGGVVELEQEYFTNYRSGEVADFFANCFGVVCAAVIAILVFVPIIRHRRKSIKDKRILGIFAAIAICHGAGAAGLGEPVVKPGIEVLQEMNFAPLEGKRVGLVTNPSGVDHKLRSTIDILYQAPNVKLVALFGPEHGVRGDVYAGGYVADAVDPSTGLPVYSLYGPNRKPTDSMLEGIDVMVYDIQDVGARCYTFISTLGLVMDACAQLGIEVIVLDRPNPLGGEKIEGCYVEQAYNSFVSQYKIPFVYGLTPGELAVMINEEGMNKGQKGDQPSHKCKLTVIPMKGWTREMTYDRTGLPWILPSPNIPYAFTALYYAAAGMCGEIYNYLQVGLGYTIPFQAFAATWIEPDRLMKKLESYNLEGVAFRPIHYKPFAGSQAGKLVKGVQFVFTDWKKVRVTEIQFFVMQALAELYPDHLPFGENEKIGLYNKVCGTDFIKKTLSESYKAADVLPYWRKDEDGFRTLSSKYHIYK